jgi:hypothetical protein
VRLDEAEDAAGQAGDRPGSDRRDLARRSRRTPHPPAAVTAVDRVDDVMTDGRHFGGLDPSVVFSLGAPHKAAPLSHHEQCVPQIAPSENMTDSQWAIM